MCKVLDAVEARGRAIGEARGEANGLAKFSKLIEKLISLNRQDDLLLASRDENARNRFFAEFGIN